MGTDSRTLRGGSSSALTGEEPQTSIFAVQETSPPYLCLVAQLDDAFLDLGRQRRQRALNIWAWCLRENKWPGWPDGTVILEAPPWHENAWPSQQRDDEQDAIDAGDDLLLQADDFGAPLQWHFSTTRPAARIPIS